MQLECQLILVFYISDDYEVFGNDKLLSLARLDSILSRLFYLQTFDLVAEVRSPYESPF